MRFDIVRLHHFCLMVLYAMSWGSEHLTFLNLKFQVLKCSEVVFGVNVPVWQYFFMGCILLSGMSLLKSSKNELSSAFYFY